MRVSTMNFHHTVHGYTEIVITDWLHECLAKIFTCNFVRCVQLIHVTAGFQSLHYLSYLCLQYDSGNCWQWFLHCGFWHSS